VPKIPTPALFGSAAGGAHYSGAKVEHTNSDIARASFSNGGASVELDEKRKLIMDDLKELFECRPTLDIFNRSWRRDAIFEDPLAYCCGSSEIAPQWFAMPKLFAKSVTVASRVLSSTSDPNRLVYSQTQEYTFRLFKFKKTIKSMVVVDLDGEGKIARLQDQWNGQELPRRWGAGALRRLNGKTTPWLVKVPKDRNTN